MIYYNPAVYTPPTEAVIADEHELPPDDPFYKFHRHYAKKSREEAIAAKVSGVIQYMDGDKLFVANSIAPFEFKPLVEEPTFVHGINWGNAYFLSEEAAQKWASELGHHQWDIRPEETYGTWKVHYHY